MSRRPVVPVGPLAESELRAIAESFPKDETVKEVAIKYAMAKRQCKALTELRPDREASYKKQLDKALHEQRTEIIAAIGWVKFRDVVEASQYDEEDEDDYCPHCGRRI